jgi:hypothetical protein
VTPAHEAPAEPSAQSRARRPGRARRPAGGVGGQLDDALTGDLDDELGVHGNVPFEMSLSKHTFRNNHCQCVHS